MRGWHVKFTIKALAVAPNSADIAKSAAAAAAKS